MTQLGGHLSNTSSAVNCGGGAYLVGGANIRPHEVTTGLTDLSVPCASGINLGPDDYALVYDDIGTTIIAAVAKIDVTLIPLGSKSPVGGARLSKAPAAAPVTSKVDGVNKPVPRKP
jgi:hypothetical protein